MMMLMLMELDDLPSVSKGASTFDAMVADILGHHHARNHVDALWPSTGPDTAFTQLKMVWALTLLSMKQTTESFAAD